MLEKEELGRIQQSNYAFVARELIKPSQDQKK
jgi:hypothetical protein